MCRALRDTGVEVVLASTDFGFNGDSRLPAGELTAYEDLPAIFFRKQWGESFKYSRPLAEWLDDNVANYDVVHIHAVFNHASIAAARACRARRVPYLIRPLGTLDPWSLSQKPLRKKLFWYAGIRRMLQGAHAIHYTTRGEQLAVEGSLHLTRGAVIPLGVDAGFELNENGPNSFLANHPSLSGAPYVLVLSRLLPTKGLDPLLAAFLDVIREERFSNFRLVLAGEGPEEYVASLKRMVKASEASASVLFAGWLEGEQKIAALRGASLLALPSYHENFGLCVIEALALSVPVLVSPHVNLAADILKAGAGWVADVEEGSLRAALITALQDGEECKRRGQAGRAFARSFSWPTVATQLKKLYEIVASNAALPATDIVGMTSFS
jgi:glycosyltransferase involved in cell wall biosynthesis